MQCPEGVRKPRSATNAPEQVQSDHNQEGSARVWLKLGVAGTTCVRRLKARECVMHHMLLQV